jgi:hypothetical protein
MFFTLGEERGKNRKRSFLAFIDSASFLEFVESVMS